MDREEFVRIVNQRYAAEGLPPLDCRDLPELMKSGFTGSEPAERDAGSPVIREFLGKRQERIESLRKEMSCAACGQRFIPASSLELYLYSELVAPPAEGYCPDCLARITELLGSRGCAENMRCCG